MKLMIRFLKPYFGQCAAICFFILLDVLGALLVPTITADMINTAISGGAISQIINSGLLMLGVSLLAGLGALLASWLCAKVSANLGRDMRNAIYDKSLSFSASDFERFGTASMITRTLNDINVIQQAFVNFMLMVVPVPVICVMGIVFSFRINADMGILILSLTVLVAFFAGLIVRKASPIFERLQRFLDRMNVVLRENITGIRVIRAFNKETYESGRMKKTFEDYAQSSIEANRLFAGLDSLATASINLCIVAILYLGGNSVGAGAMEIGDITAVTEYAIWILFYIVMAQMVIILIPRAVICLKRLSDVLSLTPEITDQSTGVLRLPEPCTDVISFENVAFRFDDAEEETVKGISFHCRRGETTAIIGGTGSGKSTIAKLLLRYHDVTDGQILLESADIRSIPQSRLREKISYVPQKAWLFSGTIEENLKYGNQNASEKELSHALRTAQSNFVFDLPGGLRSHVAQGGTNFSGGQKQRLSIARALVKKADLYVFDDSFSALDFKTDAALRQALKTEMKDAALLIIAQRISTIVHADQILVLNDGKIAGIGKHEELMKTCPVYQDIAQSQMKGGGLRGNQ